MSDTHTTHQKIIKIRKESTNIGLQIASFLGMRRFSSRNRQSIRLRDYDYRSEGVYFLTICAYQRENLFVSDSIRSFIQKTWNYLPGRFPNIRLDEFVIMPNHVHGVVWIVNNVGAGFSSPQMDSIINVGARSSRHEIVSQFSVGALLGAPQNKIATDQGAASSAPTLGKIVRTFKSISAIAVNRILNRTGIPLWQRNYYERIIRSERELNNIRQYIRSNPENWENDPENVFR